MKQIYNAYLMKIEQPRGWEHTAAAKHELHSCKVEGQWRLEEREKEMSSDSK